MSDNDDGKAFMRQYAQEIANALLDETPRVPSSVDESVPRLYRALCFDEPMLQESEFPNLAVVASALARKLADPSSNLALSNRLVQGIVFLCRQRTHTTTTTTTKTTTPATATANANSNANPNADTESRTEQVKSMALAKLAFAVFVQVPLQCCCHMDRWNVVTSLLGSYQGQLHPTATTATATEAMNQQEQQENVDLQVQRVIEGLTTADPQPESVHPVNTTEEKVPEDNPLEEVWAAESDPSDFDYGEGDFVLPPNTTATSMPLDDFLDPTVLSRPDTTPLTKDQVSESLASLLQLVNFTLLEPLFRLEQKFVETFVSELNQLVLALLHPVQPPIQLTTKSDDDISHSMTSSSAALQDALLAPLWILRDVAIHAAMPSNQNSFSMQQQQFYQSAYLEVLRTLVAVDQACQQDASMHQTPNNSQLCTASIVGLSAFASWCSTANISTPLATTAVLDSMNDLTYVLERALAAGYKDQLCHTLVPLLELLTGIQWHQRTASTATPATSAQTLLNTGFFRQVLDLSLQETDTPQQLLYLDHALWGLCVTYPSLIGKYAMRYPKAALLVRRYNPPSGQTYIPRNLQARDCVQAILWHTFGHWACESGATSSVGQVVWKSKTSLPTAPPALTLDECKEVCQKAWTKLCGAVEAVLVESETSPKEAMQVLDEWERLLRLVAIPSVESTFQSVCEHETELLSIRMKLASIKIEEAPSEPENEGKEEEENDDDKKPNGGSKQVLVSSKARKILKQYTLYFQGSARGTSKTD